MAVLRAFARQVLAANLAMLPQALVIPLGTAAEDAVQVCVGSGVLSPARCLFGFPHPSGANGHRRRQFTERRDRLTEEVHRWARTVSV